MAINLPNASQQAACDAIVDRTDLGTTNIRGILRFYTGAQTNDADVLPTGPICDCNMQIPAFGDADSSGIATANALDLGTASGTGVIQSAVLLDRDELPVMSFSVTGIGGGGDIEISNTSVSTGEIIAVSSFTVTVPKAQS